MRVDFRDRGDDPVCQYWRSTLVSYPRLRSSIPVKNHNKDFVAACLERSQEIPLTVHLDLEYPGAFHNSNAIDPLLEVGTQRIRKLDVFLTMFDDCAEEGPDQYFKDALDDFKFSALPLTFLESLNLRVYNEFYIHSYLKLPEDLLCWESFPPTQLRRLTLHGCFDGPIQAVRTLTSFELAGVMNASSSGEIVLHEHTFLPFLSGSPSLASLCLSYCIFPDLAQLSRVTPIRLPKLKSLQLIFFDGLPSFPGLIDVPAFKILSSLRILAMRPACALYYFSDPDSYLHAKGDDEPQPSYDEPDSDDLISDWLGLMRNADPTLALVRFGGQEPGPPGDDQPKVSPLPLFVNAKVLEIGAFFADLWYKDFWEDLGEVGE